MDDGNGSWDANCTPGKEKQRDPRTACGDVDRADGLTDIRKSKERALLFTCLSLMWSSHTDACPSSQASPSAAALGNRLSSVLLRLLWQSFDNPVLMIA
jgi:hypothetical protein